MNNFDVDLPFVVSRKKYPDELRYKEDFVNIVLVFDYERHDTYFLEDKILAMQQYFVDSTDVGKLYINYLIMSEEHTEPNTEELEGEIPMRAKSMRWDLAICFVLMMLSVLVFAVFLGNIFLYHWIGVRIGIFPPIFNKR